MHTEVMSAARCVWEHFATAQPEEAKLMLEARTKAGMSEEGGIPGTGYTTAYVGYGPSSYHKDGKVCGLTTIVPLGVGWVEDCCLVFPQLGHALWM